MNYLCIKSNQWHVFPIFVWSPKVIEINAKVIHVDKNYNTDAYFHVYIWIIYMCLATSMYQFGQPSQIHLELIQPNETAHNLIAAKLMM